MLTRRAQPRHPIFGRSKNRIVSIRVQHGEPGDRLLAMLPEHNITPHIWRDDRPTTWKQRIVTRGQVRPDRCDREVVSPASPDAIDFLIQVQLGDALLIQDYGKGVCAANLLHRLIARSREVGLRVLVDPSRGRKWCDYGEVSVIKANWVEACEQLQETVTPSPLSLACNLAIKFSTNVVITLGERGLVCAKSSGNCRALPAVPAIVRDPCGAGDTVFASIGVMLATGWSLLDACQWAVLAAAQQVAHLGVTPISIEIPYSTAADSS